MRAFLVRVIETKDLVGIFVASSVLELADLVDECCDPHMCEYVSAKSGGLYWEHPAWEIPLPEPEDLVALDQATLTNSWECEMMDHRVRQWKQIPTCSICEAMKEHEASN